nr:hypothetical protein [uncultured Fusobacterium sp.]
MKCIKCDTEMILLNRYGDGYTEPREEIYGCPCCYSTYNYDEAYGQEWEDWKDD